MVDPYAHIYYDTKESYKSVKLFSKYGTTPKILKGWLTELANYKNRDWGNFGDCHDDQYGNPAYQVTTNFFQYVGSRIKYWWHQRPCHKHGHAWEVESCITPEHGSEYFSCKHCGESHNVNYY